MLSIGVQEWRLFLLSALLIIVFTSSVGVSASQDAAGTVSDEPCAYFDYTPKSPTVTDTVFFQVDIPNQPVCEVHYSEGYIEEYIWSFGGSGQTAAKSFDEPGDYTVVLTAVNHKGKRTQYERTVEVVNTPPLAEFSHSPENPMINQEITFDASESSDLEDEIEEYRWELGDSTTSTGVRTTHVYDEYGEYKVMLTVSDGTKKSSVISTVDVENAPPVPEIEFQLLPEEITTNDTIRLDASGSYDPDGEIERYRWEFGDGTAEDGTFANHSYTKPGTYNITLITEDGIDSSRETKEIRVANRPPVINISYMPDEDLTTRDRITFDASGSYNPDGDIKEIQWDFGDGSTGTGEVVEQSYDELGTYEVTIQVDDGFDITEKSLTLSVAPGENSENLNGFNILIAFLSLFVTALILRN